MLQLEKLHNTVASLSLFSLFQRLGNTIHSPEEGGARSFGKRKTRTPASLERLLLQRGTMVIKREYAWLKLEGGKARIAQAICFLIFRRQITIVR